MVNGRDWLDLGVGMLGNNSRTFTGKQDRGGSLLDGLTGIFQGGNISDDAFQLRRSGPGLAGTLGSLGHIYHEAGEDWRKMENQSGLGNKVDYFQGMFRNASERAQFAGIGGHPAYSGQRLISANTGSNMSFGGILGGLFGGGAGGGRAYSSGFDDARVSGGYQYNNPGILGGLFGGAVNFLASPFRAIGSLFDGDPVGAANNLFLGPVRSVAYAGEGVIGGLFGSSYNGGISSSVNRLTGSGRIGEDKRDILEHIDAVFGDQNINSTQDLQSAYAQITELYKDIEIPATVAADRRTDGKTRRFNSQRGGTSDETGDRLNDLMKRAAKEPVLLAELFAANAENLEVSMLLAAASVVEERSPEREARTLEIIAANAHPDTLDALRAVANGQSTNTSRGTQIASATLTSDLANLSANERTALTEIDKQIATFETALAAGGLTGEERQALGSVTAHRDTLAAAYGQDRQDMTLDAVLANVDGALKNDITVANASLTEAFERGASTARSDDAKDAAASVTLA